MAKKTVATLKDVSAKSYVKVIRTTKSPKTGAYTFKEEMVPKDMVKEYLADK